MSTKIVMNFEDSHSPEFISSGPNATFSNVSPGGTSLPLNMWLGNNCKSQKTATSIRMNSSGFDLSP